jgi:signal transduction histidine kinase
MGGRRQWRLLDVPPVLWLLATLGVALLLASTTQELAVDAPFTRGVIESMIGFTALFAALVLFLFPEDASGGRLWWIAGALIIIGLTAFGFGILEPSPRPSASVLAYAWLASRTAAALLICVALVPRKPQAPERRGVVAIALAMVTVCFLVSVLATDLPSLIHGASMTESDFENGIRTGLSGWYWVASLPPLLLTIAACGAAAVRTRAGELPRWVMLMVALFGMAQFHGELWPSAYTSIITVSDLPRIAFVTAAAAGASLMLIRAASEREALLALERQRTRALGELAEERRDYTAIVSHELASPLAAIRFLVEMISTAELSPLEQERAVALIGAEAGMLGALVADIQMLALGNGDFPVEPRPIPVARLLDDAVRYAETLPGYHPVHVRNDVGEGTHVLADSERIRHVTRNLVGNAAKYSDPGSPIDIAVVRHDERLVFEISDRGWGIVEGDLDRIFEPYERSDGTRPDKPHGLGIGLYLARKIVTAHGSELRVRSQPEVGSTFWFELEEAA